MVSATKMLSESQIIAGSERVSAEIEHVETERRVKIRVESFDAQLGWYSSASLSLGLDQLPLLEQAIAEMRRCERHRATAGCSIIPFPASQRK